MADNTDQNAQMSAKEKKRLKREQLKADRRSARKVTASKVLRTRMLYGVIGVIVLLVLAFAFYRASKLNHAGFAACLEEAGVTMYGSFECSACASQKSLFKRADNYLPYVECGPLGQTPREICQAAGVSGYPTWTFADGTKIVGVQSLKSLSELSGCAIDTPLPANQA